MNYVETNDLFQFANHLQKRGFNYDEISFRLREKGANEALLHEIIEKVKQFHLTRKRKSGFICCGIGVALLIVGCMITLFLYTTGNDIKLAMYGFTSLGTIFTFKGLVDLMGW